MVAASLSQSELHVEPGEEVVCSITVRNAGSVVDQFGFEVLGASAAWATVQPPSVSLLPEAEETVQVRFHPPRTPKVLSGAVPFGVKVVSHEEPGSSLVEEGTVEVGTFVETTAELLPRTSRGRRRGSHELAVDNRGNTRINAKLSAADADQLLEFDLEPPGIVIEPGEATFAKIDVLPVERFWRGPPQTLPFQVVVEPDLGGVPIAVDGTFLLEPRLPKWLPRMLALVALAAVLLFVLWLTVLRPAIEAASRAAIEEEIAEAQEQLAEATEQAAAAQQQAEDAAEQAGDAAEQAGEVEEELDGFSLALATQEPGESFDFRLARGVVAGGEGSDAFVVPDAEQVAISDIVLQNPQGDSGVLQIRREVEDETQVLLEVRLDNFRDLDYHFVSPVQVPPEGQVVLFVRCQNEEDEACNPAAYFSGHKKDLSEDADTD